ncbi:integration host factor, actinobacterial type [Streptosporangium sp. NPDC001559]|uniref:integration host factor, actinobacterial type n=1 Tax=Streptosporangium sp. NPDC001559 TaxID=3366187 RepID=UPI0036E0DB9E
MVLPKLTPEQRQAALAKAAETRVARARLLAEVKAGSISLEQLLSRNDEVARRIKVSQALRALPGIGSVKAAQLMQRAEVDETRRLGGLGAQQRRRLIRALVSGTAS